MTASRLIATAWSPTDCTFSTLQYQDQTDEKLVGDYWLAQNVERFPKMMKTVMRGLGQCLQWDNEKLFEYWFPLSEGVSSGKTEIGKAPMEVTDWSDSTDRKQQREGLRKTRPLTMTN
jgi:hypothetical protein